MTKQQLFDTVIIFLQQQGVRSNSHGECQYRDLFGHKCAIGCLIPDHKYSPDIEGSSVLNLDVQAALCTLDLDSNDLLLLTDLQALHDWSDNWHSHGLKYHRVKQCANAHDLSLDNVKPFFKETTNG